MRLTSLLLCACLPRFTVPESARVRCATDADCAGTQLCGPAGECVAGASVDRTPPGLSSVLALSESTVLLRFTEPATLAALSISPPLLVEGTTPSSDGSEVLLDTEAQAAGQEYTVRVTLADTAQNSADSERSFVGVAALPDLSPPELLSPADGALLRVNEVHFAWATRVGAARYTIEVARDAGFADLLLTQTQAETTLARADLEARTYFWRVRSDLGAPGAAQRFRVLLDRVYVVAGGTGALGNLSEPFGAIQPALTLAAALGVPEVDVSGGAFPGQVFLLDGLRLLGGFSADFSAQVGQTQASSLRAAFIEHPTLLSAFVFSGPSDLQDTSDALEIADTRFGSSLDLSRSDARVHDVTAFRFSTDEGKPRFDRVHAGSISINSGEVNVTDAVFDAGGIGVYAGTGTFDRVTARCPSGCQGALNVYGACVITNAVIDGGSGTGATQISGVRVGNGGALTMRGVTASAGTAATPYDIRVLEILPSTRVDISNSAFVTGGTGYSAVKVFGPPQRFAFNALIGGDFSVVDPSGPDCPWNTNYACYGGNLNTAVTGATGNLYFPVAASGGFVSPREDMHLLPWSPLHGAGAGASLDHDRDSTPREVPNSIGAYE